jgi:hypothetical protein
MVISFFYAVTMEMLRITKGGVEDGAVAYFATSDAESAAFIAEKILPSRLFSYYCENVILRRSFFFAAQK